MVETIRRGLDEVSREAPRYKPSSGGNTSLPSTARFHASNLIARARTTFRRHVRSRNRPRQYQTNRNRCRNQPGSLCLNRWRTLARNQCRKPNPMPPRNLMRFLPPTPMPKRNLPTDNGRPRTQEASLPPRRKGPPGPRLRHKWNLPWLPGNRLARVPRHQTGLSRNTGRPIGNRRLRPPAGRRPKRSRFRPRILGADRNPSKEAIAKGLRPRIRREG